jgi:hypothetical protein
MAEHILTGQGFVDLTAGTTRLFAEITTLTPGYSAGDAMPVNYFRIGMLRFGVGAWFYPPVYFDAVQQVIDVPADVTQFGFEVGAGGQVVINEGAPVPPPADEIHTDLDGGVGHYGGSVTVTWSGITDAQVDDFVTITSESWDDPGGSYNYLGMGAFYTSSLTNVPGDTPSVEGSVTTTLVIPFPDPSTYLPQTAQVKLYRNGTAPPFLVGATWSYVE